MGTGITIVTVKIFAYVGFSISWMYVFCLLRKFLTEKGKMFVMLGLIGTSLWLSLTAARLYGIFTGQINADMPVFHSMASSLFNTFQIFSLDYEYAEFCSLMENMIGKLFFCKNLVSVYFSVLYLFAPITGGAILFEIIASFFPRLKLFIFSKHLWREIMYFSELNEKSVALAESIRNEKKGFLSPIIVFTDVYIKKDMEDSQELYLSAKKIGAICVSDDITHIRMRMFFKKKIFLIDLDGIKNLQELSEISNSKMLKKKRMRNSEIYLFSNDDTFSLLGKSITSVEEKTEAEENRNFKENNIKPEVFAFKTVISFVKETFFRKLGKFSAMPRVITVNGYKNAIQNLFSQNALYEPLKDRNSDSRELNLTILGAGDIGKEIFLSAYWYGQILGYKLCINVVSKESEIEFFNKINETNPDIFNTCEYSSLKEEFISETEKEAAENLKRFFSEEGKSKEFKNIMRVYPGKDITAEPYFKFRYYCTDVKTGDFRSNLTEKMWEDDEFRLVDSDYFTINLGSDMDNLTVAEKLKRMLCQEKLSRKKLSQEKQEYSKTVVAYVIYDSALCKSLNENQKENDEITKSVRMKAFGSREDVYTVKNIFMIDNVDIAEKIEFAYETLAKKAVWQNRNKSQYDFWANVARALHIKYKVFSANLINTANGISDKKLHDEIPEEYRNMCFAETAKEQKLRNSLAWLEHRRWNAFMRVYGFRCPENMEDYLPEKTPGNIKKISHKSIPLRLHPCLVECDENGMRELDFDKDMQNGDMLDKASVDIYQKCYKGAVENAKKVECEKEISEMEILEKTALGRFILTKKYGDNKKQEEKKNSLRNTDCKDNYKKYDYPKYDF